MRTDALCLHGRSELDLVAVNARHLLIIGPLAIVLHRELEVDHAHGFGVLGGCGVENEVATGWFQELIAFFGVVPGPARGLVAIQQIER